MWLRSAALPLAILSIVLPCTVVRGQLRINEISASNRSGLIAGGAYDDWIELYNTSGAAVNTTGWFLTDKPTDPFKWPCPNLVVPAFGRVVFIASDRDFYDGTRWHTNFKITQMRQEKIILTGPALTPVDSFEFASPTQKDHSFARITDGNPVWGVQNTPNPGAANAGVETRYAAKPTFNLAPGFYPAAPLSVTITNTEPNSVVRYTTNGTNPTAASTLYTGPITVNNDRVIKAQCYSNDPMILPSFRETNSYLIGAPHTVRTVSISGMVDFIRTGAGTVGDQIACIEYFDESGVFQFETEGEMRRHGNDSWAFDQRGMRFHARDEYGYTNNIDYPLFPWMTPRDEYDVIIMKPAGSDNYDYHAFLGSAHLRDGWVQTVSQRGGLELDERTHAHQVTYLWQPTNGGYWGVYEMRERVDKDYTYYYYDQGEYDVDIIKNWGGWWAENGSTANWTTLCNYCVANDLSIPANYNFVLSQIDKMSFIDNFILNTFMVNTDWLNWNTMWWRGYKPPGVKWRYALWDMDNVADLGQNYTGWNGTGAGVNTVCDLQNMFPSASPNNCHAAIYNKLLENPAFFNDYINRYADLLNGPLHCDSLNAVLDQFEAAMLPEMPGQVARWGGSVAQWQGFVNDIRTFNCTRWNIIMGQIVNCFDQEYPIAGPYTLTVEIVGNGDVVVNTLTIPVGPWSGTWFGGLLMDLFAVPGVNSQFDHWEIDNNFVGQDLLSDSTWITLLQSDTITAFFTDIVVLPVELLDLTARAQEKDVLLEWRTATETNTDRFEVERMDEQGVFRMLGEVAAAGNSTQERRYSFIDPSPYMGVNYYRLRMVDLDGSHEYSETVAVEFHLLNPAAFEVWPNPTVEEATTLYNRTDRELRIVAYTGDGRVMKTWYLDPRSSLRANCDWPDGIYQLVAEVDGRATAVKLVVLRER